MTDTLLDSLFSSDDAPLCRAVDVAPNAVSVALLYQGELADSSQIFIVRDLHERPLAIVQVASQAAPAMVARGIDRARSAAARLGPALGRTVLLPMVEGTIEGRSYAVMPYCRRFSSTRWRWFLERGRLRPLVADWLHRVSETTQACGPDTQRSFGQPLERLLAMTDLSPRLRLHGEQALLRLASGAWLPRHVLMHGDLWKGNLLLRLPSRRARQSWPTPWSERLAVIDWAGAKARGYPFFDLVRAASSLKFGPTLLRSEVVRHASSLGCEPVDAAGYFLAATGGILEELEEFPLSRLLQMAETGLQLLLDAMDGPSPRLVPGAGR